MTAMEGSRFLGGAVRMTRRNTCDATVKPALVDESGWRLTETKIMTEDSLQKTPLHGSHVEWGGRIVEFAGWLMPVQFAGIIEEHVHTRTSCSVFDVSHMGRLRLAGGNCESFLNRICTRKLTTEPGRSFYTHVCKEDGGILDDVIVSCFDQTDWGVVCNASNHRKIADWLGEHRGDFDVTMTDETVSTAMVALQGPETLNLAQELVGTDLASIKRYRFVRYDLLGMPVVVYRSGYTGEDGFEAVMPASLASMLLPKLLGTPSSPHPQVRNAGLGARDTLRLEACYPLYGQDLTAETTPLEAGMERFVDMGKDFLGKAGLQGGGRPQRRLVYFQAASRRAPRHNYRIIAGGKDVGVVTSGSYAPSLQCGIGVGYVSVACPVGTEVVLKENDIEIAATVVAKPFYKKGTARKAVLSC